MRSHLQRKYPDSRIKSRLYIDAITASALVFICLISLKPFILSEFELGDQLILDTVITLIVFSVLLVKARIVTKMFESGEWTIKKDLITQIVVLLAISTLLVAASPLVLNNWFQYPISIDSEFVLVTFGFVNLIGFLLYFIYVSLNFVFHTSSDTSVEVKPREKQIYTNEIPTEVTIVGKNKGESVVIPKENLICISTNGHYLDITFIDQRSKKAKKLVFRNSILTIAESFKEHEEYVHCHRSHLINIKHVKSISGNSRKTEVELEKLSYKVPVSRVQKKELESKLESIS